MGLKRRGKGPFRGPTPPKVFQAVDIGTGDGRRLESIAKRFPNRKYVAVDPSLHEKVLGSAFAPPRGTAERLSQAGINVRPEKAMSFIEEMKKRGEKTRFISINMPSHAKNEGHWRDDYGFRHIFESVPKILLPNGKIFITTESPEFAEHLKKMAEDAGLKTRPLREISSSEVEISRQLGVWDINHNLLPAHIFAPAKQLTREKIIKIADKAKERNKKRLKTREDKQRWFDEHSYLFGGHPLTFYMHDKYGFYVLEITYGLKKAFPNQGRRGDVKAKRRNWPQA